MSLASKDVHRERKTNGLLFVRCSKTTMVHAAGRLPRTSVQSLLQLWGESWKDREWDRTSEKAAEQPTIALSRCRDRGGQGWIDRTMHAHSYSPLARRYYIYYKECGSLRSPTPCLCMHFICIYCMEGYCWSYSIAWVNWTTMVQRPGTRTDLH